MLVFIPGRHVREWSTVPFILNWALEGCAWYTSRSDRLNSGERTPVFIQYEAGGVPEPALAFCPAENPTPDRPADKPSHSTYDCHIPALSSLNI
jgi:hypothetical protein